jgi:HEAT repeat protein
MKNAASRWLFLFLLAGFAASISKCVIADEVQDQILRLKGKDEMAQMLAGDALVKLGEPAVEPLITCLKDQDWKVRYGAIKALGKLGDARAVDPLITCLKSSDNWLVGECLTEALSELHDARAVEPLIVCLKATNAIMRSASAKALGKLGDARAVEPLIACLKGLVVDYDHLENYSLRESVIEALGKLGDARALEPLIHCLKEDGHAADALGKLGEPAVEPLIACLKDQDWGVRDGAIKALGKLGDARAVDPLITCLKDTNSYSWRPSVADALGELHDARAVEPLIPCLKDEDGEVRSHAAKALGMLGDARAVKPLIACLKDQNVFKSVDTIKGPGQWEKVSTRDLSGVLSAAEALGKLGEARAAVDGLVGALPDWDAKDKLGAALKKLGWKPISDADHVYFWICNADGANLKTNWEETTRVLLADVQSSNQRKIENAVYAFVSLGKEDIVPKLIDILNTQGTKEMAETYLNSGHDGLDKAARSWAAAHGYQVSTGAGAGKAGWGRW